jgi:outer membrane immunogenic protein
MARKHLVLGTICGVVWGTAVASTAAVAADKPWHGLYAGLNIGGNFGTGDGAKDAWARSGWGTSNHDRNSVVGGAQIGYNFELSPPFVLGIENDFEFSGEGSPKNSAIGSRSTVPFFGSGRLRAGIVPTGLNTFVYGTAGLAFGQVDNGVSTRTRIGWTAGGGAEWAFRPDWSAKVEYLYTDISKSFTKDDWGKAEAQFHTVRLGVNYHF